jgi:hypothetical protein
MFALYQVCILDDVFCRRLLMLGTLQIQLAESRKREELGPVDLGPVRVPALIPTLGIARTRTGPRYVRHMKCMTISLTGYYNPVSRLLIAKTL